MEENVQKSSPTTPLPGGRMWATLPLSPVKAGILAYIIFYLILSICYGAPAERPFNIYMVVFGMIITAIPAAVIFIVVFGVSAWLVEMIYKRTFHTPMPQRTFVIKYVPITLLTLFIIGATICNAVTMPRSSLQSAIMADAPLPASVKNVRMLSRSGLPFDGINNVWSFEIDPADFDKLLKAKAYQKPSSQEGIPLYQIHTVFFGDSNPPAATMTDCYQYPADKDYNDNDHEQINIRIYTDKTRHHVIVKQWQI